METMMEASVPNLPQSGNLGFRSELYFDWRADPAVGNRRRVVVNTIQAYLEQRAATNFRSRIPQLASMLENQIFLKSSSLEDYMDREKIVNRVLALIRQKWHGVISNQQKATHNTDLTTKYTSAPSVRTRKSDLHTTFNSGLPHYASTAGAVSNMAYPIYPNNLTRPYPTAGMHPMANADFHGSRKRSFSATEQMLPNIYSPGDRFSCGYPIDNSEVSRLLQPEVQYGDDWFAKVESFGRVLGQNKNSTAVQDSTTRSSGSGICEPSVTAHGTDFGNPITFEGLLNPAKRRRGLNASSAKCVSSCDSSVCPMDLVVPSGHFESGSPVSENPKASTEMAKGHADDHISTVEAGDSVVEVDMGSKYDDETGPNEGISADFQDGDMKDMGADIACEVLSDSVPILCEDKKIDQDEGATTTNDSEIFEPMQVGYTTSLTELKSEEQKLDGVSLFDLLTPEEINQHMSDVGQKADKVIADEVVGKADISSDGDNFCQSCNQGKLVFLPIPIYCSGCGERVKNHQPYYSTKNGDRAQACFCTRCYNSVRGGNIILCERSISKKTLEHRKNSSVTDELWVQCEECEGWQHQICALFNDKRDVGSNTKYICPKCHQEDLGTGEGVTPPQTTLDASNLPQTLLSNHLEERLFRRLNQEREARAKTAGENPDEVPQPDDLVVRVVSSVDKRLKVKQEFLDIFPEKSYPAEFPYRAKVILLFQRIEGVDVCLFAMYVQEFGSECSLPNQRCVYISYLDSVKYFTPDIKASNGEALRTVVYHEILVGYLDYCKKRGFATCYIWACPPVKGEDYILYCHPEMQKTPKPDKLRQWYQTMLKKSAEEKIVVNFSNMYEKYFVPNGESNTKITAARLPYFDGDYWSGVAENMSKKIELESGGDPEKQIKKMTRRSLKAMGHANPSAREAKYILIMKAIAESISSAKGDFIVVYLQPVCSHCHEVILSGKRRFCPQCKNYQLCERCHEEKYSGQEESHISSSGKKHALSQETVNDVPADTEDNDAIMENCFLENRHAFLNFCQGNHYQFDSFRRARHSSMMILYYLHNQKKPGLSCSLCLKCIDYEQNWNCEICPDFNVCDLCYQRSNANCHCHSLICDSPVDSGRGSKADEMVEELLNVLLHASSCKTSVTGHCPYPKCSLVRRLFYHLRDCTIQASGGCNHCKKTWFILALHSQRCKDRNCAIPRCRYQTMLKKAAEEEIVVNFSNLYEKYFVPNGESRTKITAARLPYFDGEYWSGVAENMIKKIELESPEKQIKKMTCRILEAMGHANPSASEAKHILIMKAIAVDISPVKEDFIIVYLQPVCSHCHEVVLSGKRRFCLQCKNYQLCERSRLSVNFPVFLIHGCHEEAMKKSILGKGSHIYLAVVKNMPFQRKRLMMLTHSVEQGTPLMILYHLHNQKKP